MNSQAKVANSDGRKYGTIEAACARYGFGRTNLYNHMKEGRIRAVKSGKRTLVDFESCDAYMASLPSAYPIAA